jgi:hypothetical protein
MKFVVLLSLLALSISSYARTISSVDDVNSEITMNRVHSSPSSGQYLRSGSYHVTAGRNDPFSEEIMFFLVTKAISKLNTPADYISFHKYFKAEYDKLLAANNDPGYVIGRNELFPLIRKYITTKRGIALSIEDFDSLVAENEELLINVKFIFSLKANTSYYVFTPEDVQLTIDDSGSLTTVTARTDNQAKRWTLTSSRLMHFSNLEEQKSYDLNRAMKIKPTLEYIKDVLPTKTIKDHLIKILNQL